MKRGFLIGTALLLMVLPLAGCGVAQEELDDAIAERDAAEAQVASLESKLSAAESDLAAAESDLAAAASDLAAAESALPPSRVTEPDMSNSALLIIHMQNDVVKEGGYMDSLVKGGMLPPHLEGIQAIVPNINELAAAMRAAGRPVIFCQMSVKADYSDALWPYWQYPDIMERGFFVEGTWGSQIIDELTPQNGDYTNVDKSENSFYGSELDKTLRKLKVNTVVIAGVHTNMCVLRGAEGAIVSGYYVIIVRDATAASSRGVHEVWLNAWDVTFGDIVSLKVETTSDLISIIK